MLMMERDDVMARQAAQDEHGTPVRLVGLMLPWSHVLLLSLQFLIVQAFLGIVVVVILAVLGVGLF
jgi:hypothetical protein